MQFSYTLLELYNVGTFSTESQLARDKFINRSLETAEEMKQAMEKASTHYWKCDPDKYVKGIRIISERSKFNSLLSLFVSYLKVRTI